MPLRVPNSFIIAFACTFGAVVALKATDAYSDQAQPTSTVTLVLHQQTSQSIPDFRDQILANGFAEDFPPPGVEVTSWQTSLGLGHVITLELPTYKIPEVRQVLESREWGNLTPELYTTFDFAPFWRDMGGQTQAPTPQTCEPPLRGNLRMLIAP